MLGQGRTKRREKGTKAFPKPRKAAERIRWTGVCPSARHRLEIAVAFSFLLFARRRRRIQFLRSRKGALPPFPLPPRYTNPPGPLFSPLPASTDKSRQVCLETLLCLEMGAGAGAEEEAWGICKKTGGRIAQCISLPEEEEEPTTPNSVVGGRFCHFLLDSSQESAPSEREKNVGGGKQTAELQTSQQILSLFLLLFLPVVAFRGRVGREKGTESFPRDSPISYTNHVRKRALRNTIGQSLRVPIKFFLILAKPTFRLMGSPEVVGNRGQEEEEEVGNATGLPNRLFYSASSIPDRLTFKFAGGGEGGRGEAGRDGEGICDDPVFVPFLLLLLSSFFPSPLSNGGCQEWEQMEREKKKGRGFL